MFGIMQCGAMQCSVVQRCVWCSAYFEYNGDGDDPRGMVALGRDQLHAFQRPDNKRNSIQFTSFHFNSIFI